MSWHLNLLSIFLLIVVMLSYSNDLYVRNETPIYRDGKIVKMEYGLGEGNSNNAPSQASEENNIVKTIILIVSIIALILSVIFGISWLLTINKNRKNADKGEKKEAKFSAVFSILSFCVSIIGIILGLI